MLAEILPGRPACAAMPRDDWTGPGVPAIRDLEHCQVAANARILWAYRGS
jgi:hypothetical protein